MLVPAYVLRDVAEPCLASHCSRHKTGSATRGVTDHGTALVNGGRRDGGKADAMAGNRDYHRAVYALPGLQARKLRRGCGQVVASAISLSLVQHACVQVAILWWAPGQR